MGVAAHQNNVGVAAYLVKTVVCAHIVAYTNLNGLNLFDKRSSKEKAKKIETLNKRGPKRKTGRK